MTQQTQPITKPAEYKFPTQSQQRNQNPKQKKKNISSQPKKTGGTSDPASMGPNPQAKITKPKTEVAGGTIDPANPRTKPNPQANFPTKMPTPKRKRNQETRPKMKIPRLSLPTRPENQEPLKLKPN